MIDAIYPKNPLTGQRYVHFLSEHTPEALDEAYANKIDKESGGVWDSPHYQQIFDRALQAMIPHTMHPDFPWQVTLTEDNISYNAYSFSKGRILVSRSLIKAIVLVADNVGAKHSLHSEDIFAALLAHEMAHCAVDHAYRTRSYRRLFRVLEVTSTTWLLSILGFSAPFLASFCCVHSLRNLYDHSLKRQHEFEADYWGSQIMTKAGYDPHGMMGLFCVFDFLDKKKDEHPWMTWAKNWYCNHPVPQARFDAIRPTLITLIPTSRREEKRRLLAALQI